MTSALQSRPRALVLMLVLALIAGAFAASQAHAQQATGALAVKDCPDAPLNDPYTIGDTVTCSFIVANRGFFPGEVTVLTETSPSPGGTPVPVTCLLADGTTVIATGDTMPPLTLCGGSFDITIPDDPALCNTLFRDRVDIELEYDQFGVPLSAGAFATHRLAVLCRPEITVTKTATDLSKVGDEVTYDIEVCNTGLITATRSSVIDTLLGNITASFAASLAPGACSDAQLTRTVEPGDPDPLPNTVTATYTGFFFVATAQASADTELFQPGVDVTKSCAPDPIEVGEVETCTIVVTNTGSPDSPDLEDGTISDTLTGDLLDGTNPAVASSDCTPGLPTGGSCTITTTRTVLDSDPSPLVNTVTVHYNPTGFPNDITDTAQDSVTIIERPKPAITIDKKASHFSKVGDDVDYIIKICNVGPIGVTRDSVTDTLLGDISASFAASLAPGACSQVHLTRTVLPGDPDPLVNTATATYSGGGSTATASDSAMTHLFQPSVDATIHCSPDPMAVGAVETCTIVVTNTGSADSPNLENGTISDTLTGNLLDPANPAVDSSNCTAVLPTGGTCTIVTTRTVLNTDPNPLLDTVTVHYNPIGFPNDITDTAHDANVITGQLGSGGCAPGYWMRTGTSSAGVVTGEPPRSRTCVPV